MGAGSDLPFQQIFEQSLNAISVHTIVLDEAGHPTDYTFDAVNRGFEALTGLKGADIVGRTVKEVLPSTEAVWIDRYGTVALTGEPQTFTSYAQELGRWYEVSAFRHKPLGFTVSFVDSTAAHDAEEALRDSEPRLARVLEGSQLGYWDWDLTTGKVQRNRRWAEMLGYTLEEIEFSVRQWSDLQHPDDRERAWKSIDDHLQGRTEQHRVEYRMRCKDGNYRWILDQASVVKRDEEGRPLQMSGTHTDVTDRRRFEEALERSSQQVGLLVGTMPVGVLLLGPDAEIMLANPKALELLGFTNTELIGQKATDGGSLVRREDGSPFGEGELPTAQALRTKQPVSNVVMEVQRPRFGDKRWLLLDAVPLLDEQGEVEQAVVSFIDITERRLAELDRARLQAQLQQSQKMENLGSLAGGVAHDMNNILAAILTLSSAQLLRLPPDDPKRTAFDTISKAAQRGGKLVKSLLEFARQTPAEQRPVDWNALIREALGLLERTTFSKLELRTELDPQLHPISGDSGALAHALMNLCINAADAMPEGGVLTLRTRSDGDEVLVEVEDTGTGMPAEVLRQALDPFYTTKPVGKGTGLGLSLVYSTVQAHRGRLTLDSTVGKGTLVKLVFPAAVEAPSRGETTSPTATVAPVNVLVVDDDPLVQLAMQDSLAARGHTVRTVGGGLEALEALEALDAGYCPDVVLLDLNMPGLSGEETLTRLRASHPDLPVLLSTGRSDQFALDLVARLPGVTLLPKPFSMEDLDQTLRQLLPGLTRLDSAAEA